VVILLSLKQMNPIAALEFTADGRRLIAGGVFNSLIDTGHPETWIYEAPTFDEIEQCNAGGRASNGSFL
jgi:hypothetical protein